MKPCHAVTVDMWMTARHTLTRIADLGHQHGVMFGLENLTLSSTARRAIRQSEGLPDGCESGRPAMGVMLEMDRAQIGEGILIELLGRRCALDR